MIKPFIASFSRVLRGDAAKAHVTGRGPFPALTIGGPREAVNSAAYRFAPGARPLR